MKSNWARWQANFFTGLAVVLPAVISIAVLVWLFGTVSNITDMLLVFLPHTLTHTNAGNGPMRWYWSLVALVVAVLLISVIGRLTRNYLGKKLIQVVDETLLRIPLLNKIYGALKQINEAFTSSNKTAFKQVVLVEYPCAGKFSVGFVTSEEHAEASARLGEKVVGVFIPTTPNPTSGFIILVPAGGRVRAVALVLWTNAPPASSCGRVRSPRRA
ncbi:MAG: DUF502 domain-containing protein [Verrucomicrobia bacterium]|nr:DUF502 domain-containing protein [Verrucomicrobiota bacterium]